MENKEYTFWESDPHTDRYIFSKSNGHTTLGELLDFIVFGSELDGLINIYWTTIDGETRYITVIYSNLTITWVSNDILDRIREWPVKNASITMADLVHAAIELETCLI